jgi:hypothetical protein
MYVIVTVCNTTVLCTATETCRQLISLKPFNKPTKALAQLVTLKSLGFCTRQHIKATSTL